MKMQNMETPRNQMAVEKVFHLFGDNLVDLLNRANVYEEIPLNADVTMDDSGRITISWDMRLF